MTAVPSSSQSRRRPALIAAAVVLLAAAAVGVYFAVRGNSTTPSRHTQSTTAPTTQSVRAPASVTVPAGLKQRGLDAHGVYPDGWLQRDVRLHLGGGPAGILQVSGTVPPMAHQTVNVYVDGHLLTGAPTPAGTLDLRLLVPPASGNRTVELRFARDRKLEAPDKRIVAAKLSSIGVAPMRSAPASVRVPADLSRSGVVAQGVYADGWTGSRAMLALAGGPAAQLAVRGKVPAPAAGKAQQLKLLVNGDTVLDEPVQPGALDLHALIPASPGVRRVELAWATAGRLSPKDPRRLAARLSEVGVEPIHGVRDLRIPADLSRAGTISEGIYADGWATQDARVALAGGPAAALEIAAESIAPSQSVDVLVNGTKAATLQLPRGASTLRIPVAPSARPRIVELRFAHVAPISQKDPRRAAALLKDIAVRPVSAAAKSVVIPADLTRPGLVFSGIFPDGWAQQDVLVALAGGPATTLDVAARTPRWKQSMTLSVNGRRLGAAKLQPGRDLVRAHVPASAGPRLVALHFASTHRIAADDPRQAATLLTGIALAGATTTRSAAAGVALHAALSGAQAVPPIQTNGTGTFTATLAGSKLHWTVRTTGLSGSIIAAVIHTGVPGKVGPPLLDLCRPCDSTQSGTATLSPTQARTIRTGSTYLNVGTGANPNGEIRGAIR